MPFFMSNGQLVYYAHVPKCGGSSVASYIRDRFGPLAFHDNRYLAQSETARWTKSSPQHVDRETLDRLIPASFFGSIFAIVRHPVDRAISTYHFQREVEHSIPENQSFAEWLGSIARPDPRNCFRFDNHVRPMSEIVPEGATIFYLEHGLDGLVPWFDTLSGNTDGPRAILPENKRGEHVRTATTRVKPTAEEIALVAEIYSDDFKRFGYLPDKKSPSVAPPEINSAFLAESQQYLKAASAPMARLRRKVKRKLHAWLD